MSVPGVNLLNMASRLIAFQTLVYYKFIGRSLNSVGQDVAQYAPPVSCKGSFQSVPRKLYPVLGLDLQRDFYNFYSSTDIIDIDRDTSADQFTFNGQRFQTVSDTDWFVQDGWKGVLLIHIGIDPSNPNMFGFGAIPAENNYTNFNNGNFVGVEPS